MRSITVNRNVPNDTTIVKDSSSNSDCLKLYTQLKVVKIRRRRIRRTLSPLLLVVVLVSLVFCNHLFAAAASLSSSPQGGTKTSWKHHPELSSWKRQTQQQTHQKPQQLLKSGRASRSLSLEKDVFSSIVDTFDHEDDNRDNRKKTKTSSPTLYPTQSPAPTISFAPTITAAPTLSPTTAVPTTISPTTMPSSSPTVSLSPTTTMSPTQNEYTVVHNDDNNSYSSVCDRANLPPDGTSPIHSQLVSFTYALSLQPDLDHLSYLPEVERMLNMKLSKDLMEDCTFDKNFTHPRQKPFEVLSMNTVPADVLDEENGCGEYCRLVFGQLTAEIFYLTRRRRLDLTDPAVSNLFGASILRAFEILPNEHANITSLQFRGFNNLAAFDTFGGGADEAGSGTEDDNSVAGIASIPSPTSTGEDLPMGWGAAVVGLAAVVLVVVGWVAFRRKRKEIRATQPPPKPRDMEHYTYDDEEEVKEEIAVPVTTREGFAALEADGGSFSHGSSVEQLDKVLILNDLARSEEEDDATGFEVQARSRYFTTEQPPTFVKANLETSIQDLKPKRYNPFKTRSRTPDTMDL